MDWDIFKHIVITIFVCLFIVAGFLLYNNFNSKEMILFKYTDVDKELYFAYGSNLKLDRFSQRIGRDVIIQPEFRAYVNNHELVFPRKSGVAGIRPKFNSKVWGVVYYLTSEEMEKLNVYEGYKENRAKELNSYNLETIDVVVNETSIPVKIYMANEQGDGDYLPSEGYLDTIINGAKECKLPIEYIQFLESIEHR